MAEGKPVSPCEYSRWAIVLAIIGTGIIFYCEFYSIELRVGSFPRECERQESQDERGARNRLHQKHANTTLLPEFKVAESKPLEAHAIISETVATKMRHFLRERDCRDVYLDVGSNIGVQIRKLFQPRCYPKAPVLPTFDKYFEKEGTSRRKRVCAFGFEPNPRHSKRLELIQSTLQKDGSSVMYFTNTAVAGRDADDMAFMEGGTKETNLLGSRLDHRQATKKKGANDVGLTASVVSLHSVLREIKEWGKVESLVIKLDCEGSEFDAVPDAIVHGVFCSAANSTLVLLEEHARYHPRGRPPKNSMGYFQHISFMACEVEAPSGNNFKMINLDDESYYDDNVGGVCALPLS